MIQENLLITTSPNDSYLEEQIISCVLNDHSENKEVINECLKHSIDESYFTGPRASLWKAAMDIHMRGNKIEEGSLIIEAKAKPGDIVEIANSEASPANAKYYIEQLQELDKKRKLAKVALIISDEAEKISADELKGKIYQELDKIVNNDSEHEVEMADEIRGYYETWEQDEKDDAGVKSGIPALDKRFKWRAGSLNIIAARPGEGKSALAAQVAFYNAVKEGKSVCYFSMEMFSKDVGRRGICSLSHVNSNRIKDGILSQDEKWKTEKAVSDIEKSNFKCYDLPGQTVHRIDALVAQRIPQKGVDLIVIDYLQLIKPHCKGESRNEQVSSITRFLKEMAMKYKVPVIVLSQLNRQGADAEPKLHHLRESGSIEQDCDNAVFIHSTDPFGYDCDIIIAKQRNGPSNEKIPMEFVKEKGLFLPKANPEVTNKGLL